MNHNQPSRVCIPSDLTPPNNPGGRIPAALIQRFTEFLSVLLADLEWYPFPPIASFLDLLELLEELYLQGSFLNFSSDELSLFAFLLVILCCNDFQSPLPQLPNSPS